MGYSSLSLQHHSFIRNFSICSLNVSKNLTSLFTIKRGKYNSNWGLVRNIFSGHKLSIAGEVLRSTSFVWSPWPPYTLHCANKKRIQTSLLTLFWSPKLLQYSVQLKLCSANFHRRFFFSLFWKYKKISLYGWRTPRL